MGHHNVTHQTWLPMTHGVLMALDLLCINIQEN
jgi:hypothetical protein